MLLGGGHALEGADVGELGVVDDDADGLGGVHDGAAADRNDAVRLRGLEGLNAGLDVLDAGVGLDIVEEGVLDAGLGQRVEDLVDLAGLDDVLAGADEGFLAAVGLELGGDLQDRAAAVVGYGIEYDAVGHA